MMPSVDVYARQGDKLTENWITLDFVHWLKDQGLDVLKRTNHILNPTWLDQPNAALVYILYLPNKTYKNN